METAAPLVGAFAVPFDLGSKKTLPPVNIHPTLEDKVDIARNAVDFAHVLGIEQPRVALLSALETVAPSIAPTIDAAALCKTAERGQIDGAILDSPLTFDNAVSAAAAAIGGAARARPAPCRWRSLHEDCARCTPLASRARCTRWCWLARLGRAMQRTSRRTCCGAL